MKRSPLTRRTALQTRTPIKRAGRLNPVNRTRRARLFAQQYGEGGKYAEWLRSRSCAACTRRGGLVVHHVRSRGAGGTWKDCVPLCTGCHHMAHQHGNEAVELLWEVSLTEDAAMYVQQYQEENPDSGA